jgi:serine/threonine-protein kinase
MPDLLERPQSALADRYTILRELGRGSVGIVYLAHEMALDRPVALKLLPPELAADVEWRERFVREASAGRRPGTSDRRDRLQE